jgi:hypothetical protein
MKKMTRARQELLEHISKKMQTTAEMPVQP